MTMNKMKGKTKKRLLQATVVSVIVVLVVLVALFLWVFPKIQSFTPHYLTYHGSESRIFFASATSSYSNADKTYIADNGQNVTEGAQLFTLSLTLRNDYSSDYPPPTTDLPVAPIDGTAYLCLKATLYGKSGVVDASNVSQSDFEVSSPDQTSVVLASGQTKTIQITLVTDNVSIQNFLVNMVFLGDSIPAN
jgi:hypothetical protein